MAKERNYAYTMTEFRKTKRMSILHKTKKKFVFDMR